VRQTNSDEKRGMTS